MGFIDQILNFLRECWEYISPFYVMPEYERGVVMRLGIFNRMIKPGFNWKLSALEEFHTTRITTTTLNVKPQTLTTKDLKNVVVSSIVKYRIVDAKIFLLEVEDAVDAIADICQGVVKQVIMDKTWEQCSGNDLDNEIQKRVRNQAKRWGIEIDFVTITEIAIVRSIRILNNT